MGRRDSFESESHFEAARVDPFNSMRSANHGMAHPANGRISIEVIEPLPVAPVSGGCDTLVGFSIAHLLTHPARAGDRAGDGAGGPAGAQRDGPGRDDVSLGERGGVKGMG